MLGHVNDRDPATVAGPADRERRARRHLGDQRFPDTAKTRPSGLARQTQVERLVLGHVQGGGSSASGTHTRDFCRPPVLSVHADRRRLQVIRAPGPQFRHRRPRGLIKLDRPDPRPDAAGLGVRAGPESQGIAAGHCGNRNLDRCRCHCPGQSSYVAGAIRCLRRRRTRGTARRHRGARRCRGCAAALDEALLLVHGVPMSFGERGLGTRAQLSREDAPCSRPRRTCSRRRGPPCEL